MSPDGLEHRRVRTVGELLENQCQGSLARLKQIAQDRMHSVNRDDEASVTLSDLINSRVFSSGMYEFFRSS